MLDHVLKRQLRLNIKKIKKIIYIFMIFIGIFTSVYAKQIKKSQQKIESFHKSEKIQWVTEEFENEWSDHQAIRGGTLHLSMSSFPSTLRFVGPDANGFFRSSITSNFFPPLTLHPVSLKIIPVMASHWAHSKDEKTLYLKLRPEAKWSDQKPITAQDYIFTLDFYRSKHIIDPFYNTYYTDQIKSVKAIDPYTIAIEAHAPMPLLELVKAVAFSPLPRHFYKLDEKFIKTYNWKVPPTSGAYDIFEVTLGKKIIFKRKQNWWGDKIRYLRFRFNADYISFKLIRDANMVFENFKKGNLDVFQGMNSPTFWYGKEHEGIFKNGYAYRIWFENKTPQGIIGIFLNLNDSLLVNKNIREGIHHSLDFNLVLEKIYRGDFVRMKTGYDGYEGYENIKINPREYNPKKATGLFKEAGYTVKNKDGFLVNNKGDVLKVELLYGAKNIEDRLIILVEQAKKIGLKIDLKLESPVAFFRKIRDKKFQMSFSAWSGGMTPDFYSMWHSEGAGKEQTNNMTNLKNAEMDSLIVKFREETSFEKRFNLAHRIQEIIFESSSYIPAWKFPFFREAFYRYWRLPKHLSTPQSQTAFDPFSEMDGGLFWFDPVEHKKVIQSRRNQLKLEPVLYKRTLKETLSFFKKDEKK